MLFAVLLDENPAADRRLALSRREVGAGPTVRIIEIDDREPQLLPVGRRMRFFSAALAARFGGPDIGAASRCKLLDFPAGSQ
jgi:hypothetical protein